MRKMIKTQIASVAVLSAYCHSPGAVENNDALAKAQADN
jgi:hypothetical protein